MPSSDYYESISILSKCTVNPISKSTIETLPLSVSDLPMLTCQYIQKGCLFSTKPDSDFVSLIKNSLSKTLSIFPALAGRLSTDSNTGRVVISCCDSGALFVHARSASVLLADVFDPESESGDIPVMFRRFFAFDDTLSYDGHTLPIAAVQVTELSDSLFIGCSVNHAVVDGTSFWNFFNTFAEICRTGSIKVSKPPCFNRNNVLATKSVLRFPTGRPEATFSGDEPIRERIFHFRREAILEMKKKANGEITEVKGKAMNDTWMNGDHHKSTDEISSFQSLSAQVWRSVTRARKLAPNKTTTFRMAVNCRHRVDPKMDPVYFGNAIQSIPTVALVGEVLGRDLGWSADLLHRSVRAHDNKKVKIGVEAWENDPRCFPLGNFDGAMITMGSSPRFPMYDNDFGWGRPVAVRSGKANKFDGKLSAFPGRDGDGSVDLEMVLAPETMEGLERDEEFMQYVY